MRRPRQYLAGDWLNVSGLCFDPRSRLINHSAVPQTIHTGMATAMSSKAGDTIATKNAPVATMPFNHPGQLSGAAAGIPSTRSNLYRHMEEETGHGCYGGGKQRCGRCGIHGSGEVCGTVVDGRPV